MPIRHDPDEFEPKYLREYAVSFTDKRVLEVGAGNGRLTWLFAKEASSVLAIDPSADKIKRAIEEMPAELEGRVTFKESGIEEFSSEERFDLAILSWSL